MTAHAKLSPSAAHRWMHCPGSIRLCAGIPRKPGGVHADEGSAAHALAEKCLKAGQPASYHKGVPISGGHPPRVFKVTDEMVDAVQCYLDEVARVRAEAIGATCRVEQKLDLAYWIPGGFGTADHVCVEPLGMIQIHDLKYGKGVVVEVHDEEGINPQFGIYALGAIGHDNPHGCEEVEIAVVQPRAPHRDGPVRSHRMEVAELLAWGETILIPAARATQDPEAPLNAGSWCRWCDALDLCPQARKVALQAAGAMFADEAGEAGSAPVQNLPVGVVNPPSPATMTQAQKARVYAVADKVLEPWLKAVKASYQEDLAKNGPDDWYKLVAGRATRKWADPDAVELKAGDLLGEKVYEEPKLKSPAQMEKTLKAEGLDPNALKDLVTETRGVSIAPLTDKRPALPAGVEMMFPEQEEGD